MQKGLLTNRKDLPVDDHPVSAEMKNRILNELEEIERKFDVKVLYACESGSRGWGFASTDSDYDVRFIYVHKPEWYLTVEPGRDVIERPLDDELDISGWELRKALGLLKNANPTLLEWLDSPIVYREDSDFMDKFRTLAIEHFSSLRARYHYLSMAKKNFRGYLQGETVRLKKYLYVLRPLLAVKWIDERATVPPMPFSLLLDIVEDSLLLDEISYLLEVKRANTESQYGEKLVQIHNFIEQELDRYALSQFNADKSEDRLPVLALDHLLKECVMS
ncbi:nucleotidyltransferase domain-containing protein [Budviciaceae bacterium CWB-B4]|uniref:Nucleotidyltransferase domain-containing protein n=1 Tax=Limnobaculum xujianqingii TaxID=2738837 RepID=A0A9D7FWV2_9GAMM|nr:nucleotidyltransferase domain-containing protein [Limnobaculum xujianqingii]MBK5178414.1 nucleotidyltransferase domain-containing protein [Limnobaculum xujianqingii]